MITFLSNRKLFQLGVLLFCKQKLLREVLDFPLKYEVDFKTDRVRKQCSCGKENSNYYCLYISATNPNRTTVTVSQSSRAFRESDGTVTIFIEREGNLALVSVVM